MTYRHCPLAIRVKVQTLKLTRAVGNQWLLLNRLQSWSQQKLAQRTHQTLRLIPHLNIPMILCATKTQLNLETNRLMLPIPSAPKSLTTSTSMQRARVVWVHSGDIQRFKYQRAAELPCQLCQENTHLLAQHAQQIISKILLLLQLSILLMWVHWARWHPASHHKTNDWFFRSSWARAELPIISIKTS